MKINIAQLEFKFKFRDDIDFPASMTLLIGQFEVRGFTIRKSKFQNNDKRHALFPPAKNMGGKKWLHLFHSPDKKEWDELQDAAIKQFNEEHENYLLQQAGKADTVDNLTF